MDRMTLDEVKSALCAMKIEIEDAPRKELRKYLRLVLDTCQHGFRLAPVLDLTTLPEWPPSSLAVQKRRQKQYYTPSRAASPAIAHDPTSLAQAVERDGLEESADVFNVGDRYGRKFRPGSGPDPIVGLRTAVLELAKLYDCGSPWIVFGAGEECVNVRVVSVRKVHRRAPVFVVLYRGFRRPEPGSPAVDEHVRWAVQQSTEVSWTPPRYQSLDKAKIAGNNFLLHPLALRLLVKLLRMNEDVVPNDFPIQFQPGEAAYKISALSPPSAPPQIALLELKARTFSCAVCKRRPVKECTQCFMAAYCGRDCQRAHWDAHSKTCLPRTGGRWVAVQGAFVYCEPSRFQVPLASLDPVRIEGSIPERSASRQTPSGPRRSEKLFLMRIFEPEPGELLICDSRRVLLFSLGRGRNESLRELFAEVRGARDENGIPTIYRWAKRTGEWTYDICLDRAPPAEWTGW
ncbi:uncharacterized protein BXZ73DRAFT_100776 [Epithele typhae]|uniref:uncharacterized protein n=1 Tax=Epithele typhae TaxID=378194 RepID=UPI0020075618|nr:uncharacterized protein BXZ73DRAFT_100776 [Epithele typhae]KAH9934586.1 hypothetical protein BXZ73DRAFT_100776 [Epithele typhae]